MAFKKQALKVKVGEQFTFIGQNDYFTNGRKYEIEAVDYENGSENTSIEMIDNDREMHWMNEKWFMKNFILEAKAANPWN